MGAMASQITSLTIFYSAVYSGADQRKHQSSASLAFVRGIHRSPVNSPLKWPVTRKIFPFDDVIMVDWPYIAGGHNHIQQLFTVAVEPFLQYSLDIDIAAHGFCAIYHGPMQNCWSYNATLSILEEFRHRCACDLIHCIHCCIQELQDGTFFPVPSHVLSRKIGYWSSWMETNFVHQISCPEETKKERWSHPLKSSFMK